MASPAPVASAATTPAPAPQQDHKAAPTAPQGAGAAATTMASAAPQAAGTPPSTNCCSGFLNSALSLIKASFNWAVNMLTYVVTCGGCFCGSSNNTTSQNGSGTTTT